MSKRLFPRDHYYMDLTTGELLTYAEMIERAETEYDFDDWTNALELWDCFDLTNIPATA